MVALLDEYSTNSFINHALWCGQQPLDRRNQGTHAGSLPGCSHAAMAQWNPPLHPARHQKLRGVAWNKSATTTINWCHKSDHTLRFVCFLFGVSKPFNAFSWHHCLGFLSPPNEGSIDVRLFYGTEKKDVLRDLMDDKVFVRRVVVLTTYQTLESDYRRQVNLTKVTCEWCGRLFQKSKLFYHQKYFCGPDAQRTEKQMKSQRKADYKEQKSCFVDFDLFRYFR